MKIISSDINPGYFIEWSKISQILTSAFAPMADASHATALCRAEMDGFDGLKGIVFSQSHRLAPESIVCFTSPILAVREP